MWIVNSRHIKELPDEFQRAPKLSTWAEVAESRRNPTGIAWRIDSSPTPTNVNPGEKSNCHVKSAINGLFLRKKFGYLVAFAPARRVSLLCRRIVLCQRGTGAVVFARAMPAAGEGQDMVEDDVRRCAWPG
jgi:hypothetical protein